MKNKTILVTGGAGFIGSHLCKELIKNNTVYSLDNYFTGSIDNHIKNVIYINGSTVDIELLMKSYNIKPDFIFHLGEYSRVEQSFEDLEKVIEFNKNGTLAVLEYVRKHTSSEHKCKLLYAGSSTKFGDDGDNSNASPYAWSKSSNTELVKNYGKWFNIDYRITYFYNVYGGNEIKTGKYATLIALFKEKYLKNEPMTVVSPGTQKRNFTYINDTIEALILIADKGQGDEYGIASDDSFTVLDIAKVFTDDPNEPLNQIIMLPERKGNRITAEVKTQKTKQLGWNPRTNLINHIIKFKMSNKKGI